MSEHTFRKLEDPEGVADLDAVEEVIDYQGSYADKSAILNEVGTVQSVRVHHLRTLRDDWEIVDTHYDDEHRTGYVLFKRKVE